MIKLNRKEHENNKVVQDYLKYNIVWNGVGKFSWRVISEKKIIDIKKILKPHLLEMTAHHCAFCDYLLSPDNFDVRIEHFYPKSQKEFHERAYQWDNLFPSCDGCTRVKGDRYKPELLKPDDNDYFFEKFFHVTGDGKIIPSINSDNEMHKKRAEVTICLYHLNKRGGLLSNRKKWIKIFRELCKTKDFNPNEHPFRFLLPIVKDSLDYNGVINDFLK